jgi:hypothetical protein
MHGYTTRNAKVTAGDLSHPRQSLSASTGSRSRKVATPRRTNTRRMLRILRRATSSRAMRRCMTAVAT